MEIHRMFLELNYHNHNCYFLIFKIFHIKCKLSVIIFIVWGGRTFVLILSSVKESIECDKNA